MKKPKHTAQCIAKDYSPMERWCGPQVTGYERGERLTWLRCNSPNCDVTICFTEEEISSMAEAFLARKRRSSTQRAATASALAQTVE